jgi:hypothetical protein
MGPAVLRALAADAGVGVVDDGNGECGRGRLRRFSTKGRSALCYKSK